MEVHFKVILLTFSIFANVQARAGFGPGEQDWGYVDVRPECHMFWWLHYTTADENYTERPLLVWLQGGPASSASGSGNIKMSGLVDQDLNIREHSWVHKANMLYVDNPVGAGYSYVDVEKGGRFVTNTSEAASDFIELLKGFFQLHPEFETVPLYLMGESFGGKFAPAFAELLYKEVKVGSLRANLKGIGMAYPAAQYLNNILGFGDTLFQAGIIDGVGKDEIDRKSLIVQSECNMGNWQDAGILAEQLFTGIMATYNLSFFRMIENVNVDEIEGQDDFNDFMDKTVSPLLNLTVPFGKQRAATSAAIVDKLMPSTGSVEYLINNSQVKVFVYNGQLDWVINTYGTYSWVKNLVWHSSEMWNDAKRNPFYVDGIHEGHEKKYAHLAFYWIKRAGHRLPNDNPKAMNYILKRLIGF